MLLIRTLFHVDNCLASGAGRQIKVGRDNTARTLLLIQGFTSITLFVQRFLIIMQEYVGFSVTPM